MALHFAHFTYLAIFRSLHRDIQSGLQILWRSKEEVLEGIGCHTRNTWVIARVYRLPDTEKNWEEFSFLEQKGLQSLGWTQTSYEKTLKFLKCEVRDRWEEEHRVRVFLRWFFELDKSPE